MLVFVLNSILLGVGLAMDAFSVSMANGLADPYMKKKRILLISGTFSFFQFLMPMVGWMIVHYLVEIFGVLKRFIPWIALALLAYIGGKMIFDAVREGKKANAESEETDMDSSSEKLTLMTLFVQGIATSIDALSVGLTIQEYGWLEALLASLIIAVVTLIICIFGVLIGKKFGMKLAGKATLLGGIILIGIGLEIFIKGVFFS